MKSRLIPALFVCAAPLAAQSTAPAAAPAASAESQVHTSSLGFSYSLPADWEVIEDNSSLPDVQKQAQKYAATDAEKRAIDCVQIALTARHGKPASVVVIAALPFDCYGEPMTVDDLPGFARGAMQGMDKSFDLSETVVGAYTLGPHRFWIERSKGNVKGHAELQYTFETVCSVLKRGAVCWMAMAADKEALAAFESGAATLDGDARPALVPAPAFDKKPS